MRLEKFSAIELIQIIAIDRPETESEEVKVQRDTFIAWCKEWLEKHPEEVKISQRDRELQIIRGRSEALVTALVGKTLAEKWWSGKNLAFNGKTPEEMWEVDPTEVYRYLLHHTDFIVS